MEGSKKTGWEVFKLVFIIAQVVAVFLVFRWFLQWIWPGKQQYVENLPILHGLALFGLILGFQIMNQRDPAIRGLPLTWWVGLLFTVVMFALSFKSVFGGAIWYGIASGAGWVWNRLNRSPVSKKPYTDDFATNKDLKDLLTPSNSPLIGRALLLSETRDSKPEQSKPMLALRPGATGGRRELGNALIVGPNRSGKGLHLISQLLTWQGSAVIVDIKGELYEATGGYRSKLGEVIVLDSSGQAGQYDPFQDLAYSDESLRAAAREILDPESAGSNQIFPERAVNGLYALFRAAILSNQPVAPFVNQQINKGLLACFKDISKLGDAKINNAVTRFLDRPITNLKEEDLRTDRFLTSSFTNMGVGMQHFDSDAIMKLMSGSSFKATDLMKRPITIYLVFWESELKFTHKALAMIQVALMTALIREFDLNPQPNMLPTLFCFDEAFRCPVNSLPEYLSTIAGRGMSALVYFQTINQIDALYGEDRAETVRDNCQTQIYYRPNGLKTANYMSEKLGHTSFEDVSRSESVSRAPLLDWSSDSHSESTSTRWVKRELMTSEEVRKMTPENVIMFVSELPAIMGNRLKPFARPEFKARLNLPVPALERPSDLGLKPHRSAALNAPSNNVASDGHKATSTNPPSSDEPKAAAPKVRKIKAKRPSDQESWVNAGLIDEESNDEAVLAAVEPLETSKPLTSAASERAGKHDETSDKELEKIPNTRNSGEWVEAPELN